MRSFMYVSKIVKIRRPPATACIEPVFRYRTPTSDGLPAQMIVVPTNEVQVSCAGVAVCSADGESSEGELGGCGGGAGLGGRGGLPSMMSPI
jgi:hypothetical protein